jgi:hypothetical protein
MGKRAALAIPDMDTRGDWKHSTLGGEGRGQSSAAAQRRGRLAEGTAMNRDSTGERPPLPVVPVFASEDYPFILQLPGADDMPSTWEEWHKIFDARHMESLEGLSYVPMVIRPDLFKAWLDTNSQVASEQSTQLYAQELLDARNAKYEARREDERARRLVARMANEPLPTDPLIYKFAEIGSLVVIAGAIMTILLTVLIAVRR